MQEVKLEGGDKRLVDCNLADIDEKAEGAVPASTIGNNTSTQAFYAMLAREMRQGNANMVADLDEDRIKDWEGTLGLHYASTDQVLKAVAKDLQASQSDAERADATESQGKADDS